VLHHDETLQEHLLAQLGELVLDAKVRSLAELVIQNLDGDGFHIVAPEELPGADDRESLADALSVVRKLEPAGCATRDYHESLVVQARLLAGGRPLERDPLLAHTVEILERHFETLEKGRPDAIAKALQKKDGVGFEVDADEAGDILELVRSLDPFPGRAYDHSPGAYIVPDVIVRRTEEGFFAEINGEEVPVLRVSPLFRELEEGSLSPDEEADTNVDAEREAARGEKVGAKHRGKSGATVSAAETAARDFAREPVRDAQWFIHSLKRREETILKVTAAIIDFQREFFMYGPSRLAPLRMKDIAEETGMHEATVSRAANGKYLRCEWGLFELKYFFSNQVGTGRPSATSAAASAYTAGRFSKEGVKEIVRQIIAEGGDGLSDQKISDQLAVRGIKVARRTVAKYRGELSLGSSFDR
jgi:RNA polymerase sigma-54 factor